MKPKYKFQSNDDAARRILVCPGCAEQLTHADVEIHPACPYCDHALEKNIELEDFILEPLVQRWISKYNLPVNFGQSHRMRNIF
ncbi:MAG: hypothetical protein WC071_01360 [Victivallaceae bacterium]